MTKRLARVAVVAAAALSFALPAAAHAETCIVNEPTIHTYVCL